MEDIRVRDVMEALSKCDPETPMGIAVHGNTWYSPAHMHSHGSMSVSSVRIHYAGGLHQDIVMLSVGLFPQDGYQPEKLGNLLKEQVGD